jgi:plastocyanin
MGVAGDGHREDAPGPCVRGGGVLGIGGMWRRRIHRAVVADDRASVLRDPGWRGAGRGPRGRALRLHPASIKIHPGDEISFENLSDGIVVPHTVTLGTPDQIGKALPPPVGPNGPPPVVWLTCVTGRTIDPSTVDCPGGNGSWPPPQLEDETISMPDFARQSYYNTGIFDPGQTVTVRFPPDLEPGTYTFFCYLHPATMTLTIEVVGAGEPTQTQVDLDAAADELVKADFRDGLAATESAANEARKRGQVQAGAEKGNAVVMRFFPGRTTVPPGTTVRWVNQGFDPHVISLERGVDPLDKINFRPPSLTPGSNYDGGFEISGAISRLFPAQEYWLKFTSPGTYKYVCPIHPGMGGTIEVAS